MGAMDELSNELGRLNGTLQQLVPVVRDLQKDVAARTVDQAKLEKSLEAAVQDNTAVSSQLTTGASLMASHVMLLADHEKRIKTIERRAGWMVRLARDITLAVFSAGLALWVAWLTRFLLGA